MDFEYIKATDFDRTWLNFELDLPLEVRPDGRPNPFYMDRPGNPVAQLEQALLLPSLPTQPPKFFFSGHRGCGKSTELRRVAVNPNVQARYWVLTVPMRELADVRHLDGMDVLLGVMARLFLDYPMRDGHWPDGLLAELDGWRAWLETQVPPSRPHADPTAGVRLRRFFTYTPLRLRLEDVTRAALREALTPHLDELLAYLNLMLTTVHAQQQQPVLVLVDDLDKLPLADAQALFADSAPLTRLPCAAVFAVSVALTYATAFPGCGRVFSPPPVSLDPAGRATLRAFVLRRMAASLIEPVALEMAITASGGLFGELRYLLRHAVGQADLAGHSRVTRADVAEAVARLRRDFTYMLTGDDRCALAAVGRGEAPNRLTALLWLGAALVQDAGPDTRCKVLPALTPLAVG